MRDGACIRRWHEKAENVNLLPAKLPNRYFHLFDAVSHYRYPESHYCDPQLQVGEGIITHIRLT